MPKAISAVKLSELNVIEGDLSFAPLDGNGSIVWSPLTKTIMQWENFAWRSVGAPGLSYRTQVITTPTATIIPSEPGTEFVYDDPASAVWTIDPPASNKGWECFVSCASGSGQMQILGTEHSSYRLKATDTVELRWDGIGLWNVAGRTSGGNMGSSNSYTIGDPFDPYYSVHEVAGAALGVSVLDMSAAVPVLGPNSPLVHYVYLPTSLASETQSCTVIPASGPPVILYRGEVCVLSRVFANAYKLTTTTLPEIVRSETSTTFTIPAADRENLTYAFTGTADGVWGMAAAQSSLQPFEQLIRNDTVAFNLTLQNVSGGDISIPPGRNATLRYGGGGWVVTSQSGPFIGQTIFSSATTLTIGAIPGATYVWQGVGPGIWDFPATAPDATEITIASDSSEQLLLNNVGDTGSVLILDHVAATFRFIRAISTWVPTGSFEPYGNIATYATGAQTMRRGFATHDLAGGTVLSVGGSYDVPIGDPPVYYQFRNTSSVSSAEIRQGLAIVALLKPLESITLDNSLGLVSKHGSLATKTYAATGDLDLEFDNHVSSTPGITLTFPSSATGPFLAAAGHGMHSVLNNSSGQVNVFYSLFSSVSLAPFEAALFSFKTPNNVAYLGRFISDAVGGTSTYSGVGPYTALTQKALHVLSQPSSVLDFATSASNLSRSGGYTVSNTSTNNAVVQIAGVNSATLKPGESCTLVGVPLKVQGRSAAAGLLIAEAHGSTGNPGVFVGQQAYSTVTGKAMSWSGTEWRSPSGSVIRVEGLTSGSVAVPVGTRSLTATLISGGGGGGSGRQGLTGTIRAGGGGGASGAVGQITVPASALSSSVSWVIGARGAGGAAQATASSNGVTGSTGASISLTLETVNSTTHVVPGGLAGTGGTAAAAAGGAATVFVSGLSSSIAGGAGGVLAGSGASAGVGLLAGGSGGGGLNAANATGAGGNPGRPAFTSTLAAGSAAGANVGIRGGGGGGPIFVGSPFELASQAGVAAVAGAGSVPSALHYGVGGSGGGGSLNGNTSGAGGTGGPAIVILEFHI